jgi:hypothetical protein
MSGYNTLKLRTLSVLENRGWTSVRTVCALTGFRPLRACYTYLLRLSRWRLLSRSYRGPGTLVYLISRRGRERLAWLRRTRFGTH